MHSNNEPGHAPVRVAGRARQIGAAVIAGALLIVASACGGDPVANEPAPDASSGKAETIVVGSANFPESQTLAEIYAQALAARGVEATTRLDIGAREAYIKALRDGSIDLIPEYGGNLLLYFDDAATAASTEDIDAALQDALPADLVALAPAGAEDKDSLNVTPEFAAKHGLRTIADLAAVTGLRLAANPEFRTRPYGLPGLKEKYGVEVADKDFQPINDGGGEATLKALLDGKVDVADIYSTTPSILEHGLVTLDDPENLFIAQNIVPLIRSDKVSEVVRETLEAISGKLDTTDLLELNAKNQGAEKAEPRDLAGEWLKANDLL